MKLFRFMSESEFNKLRAGEKLVNNTIHVAKTNSVGFCFLDLDEYKPEEAIHFLIGAIFPQICVKLETNKKLEESWGIYATPLPKNYELTDKDWESLFHELETGFINTNSFKAKEYCTTSYSIKDYKIISWAYPDFMNDNWEWKQL